MTSYESDEWLLRIRLPAGRFASPQGVPLPAPLEMQVDVVELLLEERGER